MRGEHHVHATTPPQSISLPEAGKQNVLSADVPTGKLISFLGCIKQHTFAYAAEWEVREARNLLTDGEDVPSGRSG
jgi:hypothetical protein